MMPEYLKKRIDYVHLGTQYSEETFVVQIPLTKLLFVYAIHRGEWIKLSKNYLLR